SVSVGFERTICVVQPPPLAKSGNMIASVPGAVLRSATGKVVIRNSPLWFLNPRNVTTATGTDELNVKVPVKGDFPLNGASFKNDAICPFGGIVVVPLPKSPLESVK